MKKIIIILAVLAFCSQANAKLILKKAAPALVKEKSNPEVIVASFPSQCSQRHNFTGESTTVSRSFKANSREELFAKIEETY